MSQNLAGKLKRQLYARKVTGYVLLFAMAMVFVFFGYTGKYSSMGIGSVARVNDSIISQADFQNEENRIQQYYSQLFGGSMDFGSQRQLLRQQALDNLIRAELVSQAAKREGILATDAEVRDFIVRDIPFFQENGQFQRDRYMGYLEATRSSAGDFETRVRKDIANIRTRHLFELSSRPLTLEMQKIKALQEQKWNVAFLRMDPNEAATRIAIPEADAQKQLADAAFLKRAEEYFKTYKEDYGQQETVKAQHILIGAKPGDAESDKKALAKATEIRGRIGKEDFGKLASQYSEDPGSKAKGGMLEPFSHGKMVKEFEDVAFTQKPGEISQPVKSPFGYHIIKTLEHTPGKEATFDSVKLKIAQRVMARERAEAGFKQIEEAVAKGDEAAIDAQLKPLGLSWDETGFFELGGDGVPKLPPGAVSNAVFEVSPEKPLLPRVLHEAGARFAIKYKGSKTEAPKQDASSGEMLQRRRADGVYGAWLNQYRQSAHVEMNPQILK